MEKKLNFAYKFFCLICFEHHKICFSIEPLFSGKVFIIVSNEERNRFISDKFIKETSSNTVLNSQ